jgi:uncharacterized protein
VPWPCLHELLALIGHPRVNDPPTSPAVGIAARESLLALPTLVPPAETRDHARLLVELLRPGVVGPKMHDARVAAICLGHGARELWTADRDLTWSPRPKVRNPLAEAG